MRHITKEEYEQEKRNEYDLFRENGIQTVVDSNLCFCYYYGICPKCDQIGRLSDYETNDIEGLMCIGCYMVRHIAGKTKLN